MPTYLSPGVYVEEVEAGARPIEGVGTSVAAFRAAAMEKAGDVRRRTSWICVMIRTQNLILTGPEI
jgi:phage tail sheath protein FI